MIANSGEIILFRVGLSRKNDEDKSNVYWFRGTLLEDLYLVVTDNGKIQLFDCACEMRDCMSGDLLVFETVYGKSLNQLFSNVVTFYLPLQRSGSANAFTTFCIGHENNILENYRKIFEKELKEK